MVTPSTRRPQSRSSAPSVSPPLPTERMFSLHRFSASGTARMTLSAVGGMKALRMPCFSMRSKCRFACEFCETPRNNRDAMVKCRHKHIQKSADPGPVGWCPNLIASLRKQIERHLYAWQVAQQDPVRVQGAFGQASCSGRIDDERRIVRAGLLGHVGRGVACGFSMEVERVRRRRPRRKCKQGLAAASGSAPAWRRLRHW